MLGVENIVDNIYIISDENYTSERAKVILNCIDKLGLEVLDYTVSLNVKSSMDNFLYSHDFQLFNLDEPIENILGGVEVLFGEVIDSLEENTSFDFSVTLLCVKNFMFTLKNNDE